MGTGMLYFLLVLGMISWGMSWISAKLLTGIAEPEVLVFWRFFITWVTYIPVMYIIREKFSISPKGLLTAALTALLMVLYNEMFFTGLINGLAGAGGVMVTTLVPILTFTIGCIITLKRPSLKDSLGLLLGFSGACIIMQIWHLDTAQLFKSGNVYFLIAALTWATLTHLSTRARNYTSAYTFTFYLFLFTTVFDYILVYSKGMTISIPVDSNFIINMGLLAVGATTFGTTIYFLATAKLGGQKASSFIFLVPLIALIFSFLILDEPITLNTIIGGLSAITAVYIINHRKRTA